MRTTTLRRLLGLTLLLTSGCQSATAPDTPLLELSPTTSLSATTSTTSASTPVATQPLATATIAATRGWLVIHGTGDVNLDGDVVGALRSRGYDHAWSGLDGLFVDDDLTVINLECSPSPDGPPEPKEFVFGCDPEAYPAAIEAGIDVANLGNNHGQDHGKEAMIEGRHLLEAIGLNPVGAGANQAEAGKPALFEVNGWRIAVVGFGGVFPHEGWFATPSRAGMRDGDTIDTMVAAVEAADRFADLVIVTIHWGVELDTGRCHLRASSAPSSTARIRRWAAGRLVGGQLRLAEPLTCWLDDGSCPGRLLSGRRHWRLSDPSLHRVAGPPCAHRRAGLRQTRRITELLTQAAVRGRPGRRDWSPRRFPKGESKPSRNPREVR